MVSFFITLYRLIKAIWQARKDPVFRATAVLTLTLLLSGTLFYRSVEGWGWIDAAYFSVATLSTVGYGDLAPVTNAGKIFTICYILVGLGVFVTFVTSLAQALLSGGRREDDQS